MKYLRKSLLTLTIALCTFVCAGIFAACGGGEGGGTASDYSVTVLTAPETPASGVEVSVVKGGVEFSAKTTDANGKVTFVLADDNYTVALYKLPEGYSVPSDADMSLSAEKRDLTVTLVQDFAYEVKLVNPDGTPYYAENVRVGICTLSGNCLTPQLLGADGIARCSGEKGDYHVQILNLPDTVTFDKDENGYYTGALFSATVTEMTITIYPSNALNTSESTAMTAQEKDACAYLDAGHKKLTAHQFSGTWAKDETLIYTFTPAIDGIYSVLFPSDSPLSFRPVENVPNWYAQALTLEGGKPYSFKLTSAVAGTAEFVLVSPVTTTAEAYDKTSASVNLDFAKTNACAVIRFLPRATGIYTATVQGTQTAFIQTTSGDPDIFALYNADAEFTQNASCNFSVNANNPDAETVLIVSVPQNAKAPLSLQVKIERTGDTQDQTIDVAVSETLTVFEKPDGTELTPVSLDGTANLVYDNTNKYYRLGENGPVVTVQLTKAIDRLRFGSPFIYLELDNPRAAKYVFDVTDTVPNAPGSVMHDYRLFLRGFKDYESKPGTFGDELSIPETLENENCYAKFANADGVYPLTEELKTFLQLFYANNEASIEGHLITAASENCGWMLPLYYYAEAEAAADAIVGEYELVSFTDNGTTYQLGDDYQGVTVENNSVTLSVTNTKFTITNNLSNETISGTWTKNSDTSYTFTVTFFNADDPVTVDTETGEVTVEDMMTYVFKKVTTE